MTLTGRAPGMGADPGLVVSISAEVGTVVALQGNADLAALPLLVDVLAGVISDRQGAVVVDLAEAEFIDTASVRAMGHAAQCLSECGRPLTLRSPSRLAAMLLSTFGLSHLVETDRAVAQ